MSLSTRRSSSLNDGTVVSLNVGGKSFTTYKATLAQYPDSMLAAMFNGAHPLLHHNGEVFLDRDGELFEYVLDFLRSGPDFELPADQRTCRRLLREFRYFQLPTSIFNEYSTALARVYVVGGCPDPHMHRPLGTISCYDTQFEGWCDVAELPVARACVAAATLGGKLYVLGGKDSWGKELTGVYTCDLATHAVAEDGVRPMATPRHTFGAATAAGRIYAVGHGRLGDEQETVEFFDPGSAAWWSTSPLPHAPKYHAVAAWPGPCGEPGAGHDSQGEQSQVVFSSGGYVGVAGVGLTCSTDLLMLDVRTKAWRAVLPMPAAHAKHGMAACAGRIYIVGGCTTAAGSSISSPAAPERPTACVHCYDVRAARWVEADPAPLPRPLESLAAVAVGGQVHIMGGLSNSTSPLSPRTDRGRVRGNSCGGLSAAAGSTSGSAGLRTMNSPNRLQGSTGGASASASGAGSGSGSGSVARLPTGPSAVNLQERVAGEAGQVFEDRLVQDVVMKYDSTANAWVSLRSMRTSMHSMAAVAYQA